jgi:hypothetical protein
VKSSASLRWLLILTCTTLYSSIALAQKSPIKLSPRWDSVVRESMTTPTLQVVVNPPLRPGTPIGRQCIRDSS